MKKTNFKIIGTILVMIFIIVFFIFIGDGKKNIVKNEGIKIGVSVYKSNDVFVAGIIEAMENVAKEYEKNTGIKVSLEVFSAKESQRLQNDQIKRFISLNYDVLCINLVDRTNASTTIEMATEKSIPVVFFNREPVFEDIFLGENIYYVGSDAKQTGIMQAEMLIDAFISNPGIDKNKDGKLQYIMLEGEMGHQDAIMRTEWSVQTIKDFGIEMEKLETSVANWERSQALALMEPWINVHNENIEVVLSNNDDMALGAIDAFEKTGKGHAVILGIDATDAGIKAVEEGTLLGTVNCNALEQGTLMFQLAAELGKTGTAPKNMKFVDERYVKVPIKKIVK